MANNLIEQLYTTPGSSIYGKWLTYNEVTATQPYWTRERVKRWLLENGIVITWRRHLIDVEAADRWRGEMLSHLCVEA
jgi:hypothetical protein